MALFSTGREGNKSSVCYVKKVMYRVKVFKMYVKGHGQGHVLKMYGSIGKVLS